MSSVKKLYEAIPPTDSAERDRLLLEQLPEVRYIAKRVHDRLPKHIALEDLVHAGVLGLIDALHKYDPGRNVQFKSYAKFRIRGAILDSLRELDWSPRDLRKQGRRLEEAERKLRNQLNRPATESEMAAEIGLPLDKFQNLLAELHGLDLGNLHTEAAEEGGASPWCAYQPDAPETDAYFACLRSEMKALLAQAIGELPPKERQILSLYYFDELTMKETGQVVGVSESRVCQIHSAAIIRLRARMKELLESRPMAARVAPVLRPPTAEAGAGQKEEGSAGLRARPALAGRSPEGER